MPALRKKDFLQAEEQGQERKGNMNYGQKNRRFGGNAGS